MAKIEEKMLQMVVDMAAKGGKMEARIYGGGESDHFLRLLP